MGVIEKIDLFLFFVMIEFLLMVIDMLFVIIDDVLKSFFLDDFKEDWYDRDVVLLKFLINLKNLNFELNKLKFIVFLVKKIV